MYLKKTQKQPPHTEKDRQNPNDLAGSETAVNLIIENTIATHGQALKILARLAPVIKKIAALCIAALSNGGKIIFMGNGGSAADAQHLAAELVGRFKRDRQALGAIALSVNSSTLTAIGNDYGFESIFSRQLEALANPRDLVVGISTSGKSINVINAVKKAKELGLLTVGLLGADGGKLKSLVDTSLIIPLPETARVQEMHILAGHIICEIVESEFSGE